jgi:hypothetical protein
MLRALVVSHRCRRLELYYTRPPDTTAVTVRVVTMPYIDPTFFGRVKFLHMKLRIMTSSMDATYSKNFPLQPTRSDDYRMRFTEACGPHTRSPQGHLDDTPDPDFYIVWSPKIWASPSATQPAGFARCSLKQRISLVTVAIQIFHCHTQPSGKRRKDKTILLNWAARSTKSRAETATHHTFMFWVVKTFGIIGVFGIVPLSMTELRKRDPLSRTRRSALRHTFARYAYSFVPSQIMQRVDLRTCL